MIASFVPLPIPIEGWVFVTVRRNAVARARAIKPEIPLTGNDGIPLRDEIELERIFYHSSRGNSE